MGAWFLNTSPPLGPKKFKASLDKFDPSLLKINKKGAGYCPYNSGSEKKFQWLSSLSTRRLNTFNTNHVTLSSDARNSRMLDDGIGIAKFFRGKNILITGATGFLAKALIEKILRAVPDVCSIYLLIKAENEEAAKERLKHEIINIELFSSLQYMHGKSYQSFMHSKVVPVVGNVCESDLSLEKDIANLIANKVDIIVHSAANTRFHERYDVALDVNTKGVSHLMSFAKKCKKLNLVLHVSTVYVSGQRESLFMEKPICIGDGIAREGLDFNAPGARTHILDVEGEMKLVSDLKEAYEDNAVAQKMKELGLERAKKYGWQNTYVFTKAMGEMLIEKTRREIPVVILRPSVIESTCREPIPGWIEGNRMLDPVIMLYGKGQLAGLPGDPNAVPDVVPVDMVVNACLAAIAKHGAAQKPEIKVYHIASSMANPLVFRDLARSAYEHFKSLPCLDSEGSPIEVPEFKFFTSMEDFSSQLTRDVMDKHGKMSPKFEIICRKSIEYAKHLADMYKPYAFYNGRFDNSNIKKLMECMSEDEMVEFGFDVRSIDWEDYFKNIHIPGLRKHVMKQ